MIVGFGDLFVIASVFSNGLLVTVIKKLSIIAKQRGSHFGLCLNFKPAVQIKQNGIQLLNPAIKQLDLVILCISINMSYKPL